MWWHWRGGCSATNDMSDGALTVDGFSQNRSKEERLLHLVMTGSLADRRRVREGHVQLPGKVVTVARHQGSHLGEKASFVHELPRRRQAVMTSFYSVGQLSCGQHCAVRHRGVLPFKSTIPSSHVVHGLLGKKSHGGFGSTQGELKDKSAP